MRQTAINEAFDCAFPPADELSGYVSSVVYDHYHYGNSTVLAASFYGGMFEVVDSPITRAETRVLTLRAIGVNTTKMSEFLHVSEHTIRKQEKDLSKRLGTASAVGSVAMAFGGNEPFFRPIYREHFSGRLTPAERETILGVVENVGLRQAAAAKGVQINTTRTHIKNIYADNPGLTLPSFVTLAHLTNVVYGHEPGPVADWAGVGISHLI